MYIDFREKEKEKRRERERDRQTHIDWSPPTRVPVGDQTCNLGMCPDWNQTQNVLLYWMDHSPIS